MRDIETKPNPGHDPRMAFPTPDRYDIQSNLLADCIRNFGGAESKSLHYGILCYLVCKAFNIHRMNYFADRVYERTLDDRQKMFFCRLSNDDLLSACEELSKLYAFTQQSLNDKRCRFHPKDGQICLSRGIGRRTFYSPAEADYYETYIANAHQASTVLGKTSMHIDMDLLNSFGASGYSSLTGISMNIPCADVLYFSDIVTHQGSDIMESGEFVVVNRATFGIVEVPTNAISLDPTAWKILLAKSDREWASKYLEKFIKFPNLSSLRPTSLSQCSVKQEALKPKRSSLYKIRAFLAQWIDPR